MNLNRIWIIGTVLVCIAVVGLGWVIGISPQLDEVNRATAQRAAVEESNRAQEAALATMKKQFEGIGKVRETLEELRLQLPSEDALPAFFGELNDVQAASGVVVSTVTTGDAQAYLAPAGETSTPGTAGLTGGQLIVIPVTIVATGAPDNVLTFVTGLQNGERLISIENLTVTGLPPTEPGGEGASAAPLATVNISGYIYVLLDSAPAEPVAK